ncbi:MAG TPA: LuxR C-terminal-related transcriptional regulator [Burkholderiaceae bacterium]|nr:LuxR C-terminal-related transcriptional regulator [Burkholderiaceae bacterium]
MLAYIRDFYPIDPRRAHGISLGPERCGHWNHCHETFDDAFVAKDRFYQHFLPAYDVRYQSNVTYALEDGVMIGFILEIPASRGVLDADEREVARRLGLHVREALLAHERVRRMAAQALAGHGLLKTFAHPMWLLDDERCVLFANAAAQAEQAGEARVALNNGRLVLRHDVADRTLVARLRGLQTAGRSASAAIDLRARESDAPTWLHLSMLVPGGMLGAFGDRPQVLATLFDPLQVRPLDPFALANMFGLTPTEAKVAARLADGVAAKVVAAEHGTAEATVRTQIRQVIHKLGARRLSDVVRLLHQGDALWSRARATRGLIDASMRA